MSLQCRFLCLNVVFVCVCVCAQSVWLQALMRQRVFLFLWPLSKHIKNYLITAYTAMATHTHNRHTLNTVLNTHTHTHHIQKKIALTLNTQSSPPNSPNVTDPSRRKRRGQRAFRCQPLVNAEPFRGEVGFIKARSVH